MIKPLDESDARLLSRLDACSDEYESDSTRGRGGTTDRTGDKIDVHDSVDSGRRIPRDLRQLDSGRRIRVCVHGRCAALAAR